MNYVYDQDEIVARFVAQLIPSCRDRGLPKKAKSIGIVQGDQLIAGLVYYNWSPEAGTIEMSAAALPGKPWLTRETIRQMYQYPFLTCGCQMVVMITAADNEIVLRILAAFNHSFIRIPRLMGRDQDAVLCTLTYEDWVDSKICRRFKHHIHDQLEKAA